MAGGAAPLADPIAPGFVPPSDDADWLELSADGRYEFAAWRASLVPGPGCTIGALGYERGRYGLTVGEYSWQNRLTTVPDSAFTIEWISGWGPDDGVWRRDQPLNASVFEWSLGRTPDLPEVLEVRCSTERRERNRWQFLLCHWGFEHRTLMVRAP